MSEVVEKVHKWLEWYDNNSEKATIQQLLTFQDKLSVLSCNLGQMVAKQSGNYLRAYFARKLAFSDKKMVFVKDGEKLGVAEEKARLQIQEQKETEIQNEEIYQDLKLTLSQVNRVLQCAQQRISFERQEYDRMHKLSQ